MSLIASKINDKVDDIPDLGRIEANSYNGNINIKKNRVNIPYSSEQLDEYMKCSDDPIYFIVNYVKITTLDDGIQKFRLFDYQVKMIENFRKNRFSINMLGRQMGKSELVVAYILWYAMFHADKRIYILANKGDLAREMLSRLQLSLEHMPFWLQPGVKTLNKGNIDFSNNTKIIATATSSNAIRGKTANIVYIDELAFIDHAERFWTSTYPTITSGKESQVFITSTPQGVGNQFHTLWVGATQKTNTFVPYIAKWYERPGRDENWKKETIANTSEQQFRQEHSLEFLGSGNTLLSGDSLLGLTTSNPVLIDNHGIKYYERPQAGHEYIGTVDVSKGRGRDYSTVTIIDVTEKPFRQVATFRNNIISPLIFPNVVAKMGMAYNEAMIVVENNDAGQVVVNALHYDIEYPNVYSESAVKRGGLGVTMTKKIKRIGCSNLKDLIENKKLLVCDFDTVAELTTFEEKGNSYEASNGNHDDMVMNLVMFSWFVNQTFFTDMTDVDLREMLYKEKMREIEASVPFFGAIDDGVNDYDDPYQW